MMLRLMNAGDSELKQLAYNSSREVGVIISTWFIINKTVSRSMTVTGDTEWERTKH